MTQPLTDVIAEAIRHELPLVPTTEVAVQAVLQAIDQAGYVVAPREPTEAMLEAGYGAYGRIMVAESNLRWAYIDMLSASKEGITE